MWMTPLQAIWKHRGKSKNGGTEQGGCGRKEGQLCRPDRIRKKDVREDFEEMDFENAQERTMMESCIESMEDVYDGLVRMLEGMSFE